MICEKDDVLIAMPDDVAVAHLVFQPGLVGVRLQARRNDHLRAQLRQLARAESDGRQAQAACHGRADRDHAARRLPGFLDRQLLRRQPVATLQARRTGLGPQLDRVAAQPQRPRAAGAAFDLQLAEQLRHERVELAAAVGHLRGQHRAVELDLAAALRHQQVVAGDHLVGPAVAGFLRGHVGPDVPQQRVGVA